LVLFRGPLSRLSFITTPLTELEDLFLSVEITLFLAGLVGRSHFDAARAITAASQASNQIPPRGKRYHD
jgi:hypothetical protein